MSIPTVSLKCSLRPSIVPRVSIMKRRRNQRESISSSSTATSTASKEKKRQSWFRKKKSSPCAKRPAPATPQVQRKKHKGMVNLGNTCYLNCAIQMLMGLSQFEEQLAKTKEDAAATTPAGEERKYPLCEALVEVLRLLREPAREKTITDPVNPKYLKEVVDKLTSQFTGSRQQDAHEFLSTLLDLLHDEMSSSQDHPYGDDDAQGDEQDDEQGIKSVPSTEDMDIDNGTDTQPLDKKRTKEVSAPAAKLMGGQAPVAVHNLPPTLTRTDSAVSETTMESAGGIHEKELTETSSVSPDPIPAASPTEDSASTNSSSTAASASPVDNYFTTKVRISLTCDSCGIVRTKEEEYRYISIEVNEDKEAPSLSVGLKNFFAPEKREAKCEKCSCPTAMQTMEITRLPRALILHFKRFLVDVSPDYSKITYRKNHSPVQFGETLSLSQDSDNSSLANYLAKDVDIPSTFNEEQRREETSASASEEDGDADEEMSLDPQDDDSSTTTGSEADSSKSPSRCYRLRSVVNHSGASSCHGHYTADSFRTDLISPEDDEEEKDGEWVRFNDTRVTCILPKDAMGINSQRTAYMVAYELDWHV
uniref:Ubiquitin carboxyl-terminal hydrolase n=1 Tax=Ditylum brightwellii TaxID=49249 RepID=A0A7S4RZP5_9STRA